MNHKEMTPAQIEVSLGLDLFKHKHGITSDYHFAKVGGMNTNTTHSIRACGSITTNTLLKMGLMVGYDLEEKSNIGIILRVLKDFEGK